MTYTTDGKCEVYAGKILIARAYVGGEVRVLSGTDRLAVIDKIRNECPAFIQANEVPANYYPKVFTK